jgi:hypothetical protein
VELEAIPQGERIGELVGADLVLVDHLGLRLLVGVVAEQRVVDQRAMDVGDRLGGPDRIDDAHVGVHHGLEHFLLRRRLRLGRGEWNGQRQRARQDTVEHAKDSLTPRREYAKQRSDLSSVTLATRPLLPETKSRRLRAGATPPEPEREARSGETFSRPKAGKS